VVVLLAGPTDKFLAYQANMDHHHEVEPERGQNAVSVLGRAVGLKDARHAHLAEVLRLVLEATGGRAERQAVVLVRLTAHPPAHGLERWWEDRALKV
jgi:hypothetical protein